MQEKRHEFRVSQHVHLDGTELRIDLFFSKHHKAHSCEGVESEESRIIGATFEVSHTCVDKQVVALLKYAKVTSTFCRSLLITTPILSG